MHLKKSSRTERRHAIPDVVALEVGRIQRREPALLLRPLRRPLQSKKRCVMRALIRNQLRKYLQGPMNSAGSSNLQRNLFNANDLAPSGEGATDAAAMRGSCNFGYLDVPPSGMK
jgi:hypothetical protein